MNTEIKSCKDCEFFGKSMDGMECKHPFFKDIKDYSNMIISQDNIIKNTVPEKCPKKEKQDSIFSIYKSQTTNQYFVKYPNMTEREITLYEYNNLLNEKERIFEAKMKEPVVFEKKNAVEIEDDYTNHSNGHSLQIYPSTEDELKDFVSGTCYGTLYYTENCIVIDSFFNKEKHNGNFQKTIECLYTLCSIKELNLTICNVNSKLLASIRKMFPDKELIQVNKNTVMFKIYKK